MGRYGLACHRGATRTRVHDRACAEQSGSLATDFAGQGRNRGHELDQARAFRHHRCCRHRGGNTLAGRSCCRRDYSTGADRPISRLGISAAITAQRTIPLPQAASCDACLGLAPISSVLNTSPWHYRARISARA